MTLHITIFDDETQTTCLTQADKLLIRPYFINSFGEKSYSPSAENNFGAFDQQKLFELTATLKYNDYGVCYNIIEKNKKKVMT